MSFYFKNYFVLHFDLEKNIYRDLCGNKTWKRKQNINFETFSNQ